jgi:glycosyltransferase involved in cell wall biosynthesis
MRVLHLTSSRFHGGPERQMLGLARALPKSYTSLFLSFGENGGCEPFLAEARRQGFHAGRIAHDTPRLWAALKDVVAQLRALKPDVLLCQGYKANLLGRRAARRVGVPAVAVTRGWTGESRKVRLYESLDRFELPRFDVVVSVSEGFARRVRAAGVPESRLVIIRNSAREELFRPCDREAARARLLDLLPVPAPPGVRVVVGAARLSPEKGFHNFIAAARLLAPTDPTLRFLIFGQGVERERLERQVVESGLTGIVHVAGFRTDLDSILPGADLFAHASFAEGLPNVVLEASALGLPVVTTDVDGTPEVVTDGVTGRLMKPGDPARMADLIREVLADDAGRAAVAKAAYQRVREHFTFAVQARQYQELFASLGRYARPRRALSRGGVA